MFNNVTVVYFYVLITLHSHLFCNFKTLTISRDLIEKIDIERNKHHPYEEYTSGRLGDMRYRVEDAARTDEEAPHGG